MISPVPLNKVAGHDVARLLAGITEDIERDGFAFRTGNDMRSIMRIRGLDAWPAFTSSWDDLGLTLYMADGGRYRRRRFAAFDASTGAVTRKPHEPHYQSRDYNPLNGDIERWFQPVSDRICANGFVRGILGLCTTIFDSASLRAERRQLGTWKCINSVSKLAAASRACRPPKALIGTAWIGCASCWSVAAMYRAESPRSSILGEGRSANSR